MRFLIAACILLLPLLMGGPTRVLHSAVDSLQGIDVSHHQKRINWDTVAVKANVDFAFVKATEGSDYTDSLFCHNWESLRQAGMRRGAYHFFRSYGCGDIQARHFLSTVALEPGDVVPVLDVETTDGMSDEVIVQEVGAWLRTVEECLRVRPIIYTNQFFYDRHLAGHFDRYPLWVARYSGIQPILRDGRNWHIWQYSNTGQVPGIEKPVDLNMFMGTTYMFNQYCWYPEGVGVTP